MPDHERLAIEQNKLLDEFMRNPQNYSVKFTNNQHGACNYWYNYSPPKEFVKQFSPNMSDHLFVKHPHMNKLYLQTMLDIPHINCSNYMFPKLENCHTTISIDNHQTIIATELTENDILSHIKVVLNEDFTLN